MKKVKFICVPRNSEDEDCYYFPYASGDDDESDEIEITLTNKEEKTLRHVFEKFKATQDLLEEKVAEAHKRRLEEESAKYKERDQLLKETLSPYEYEMVMKYRARNRQSLCTVTGYNIETPDSFLAREMRI